MMEWVWLGLATYLSLGLWLAFKGRLAFMIEAQVAILEMREAVPNWKKWTFKVLLRLGVMCFYPIFLLFS